MASNTQYQQVPFWDFVQAFDASNGAGVDHNEQANTFPFGPRGGPQGQHHGPPPGFPFGGSGAWGFGGRGGFGGWGGRGGVFGGPDGREHWGGRRGRCNRGPPGRGEEAGFVTPGRHGKFCLCNPPGEEEGFVGAGCHGRHCRRVPPRDGEEEGPVGPGGHGRQCRRDPPRQSEEEGEKSRTASPHGEDKEGEASDGPAHQHGRHGRHGRGGRRGGPGGWGHHGHRGPPPFGGPEGFDLSGLFEAINAHPIAQTPFGQMLRQYAEQAGFQPQESGETVVNDSETFVPPVDIFSTETSYILHISLPGAKKEDVGVNWDAEKGVLNIAGVIYRQGDEEFLKTLTKSERKVGMFEKIVKLPPGGEEKEEVDGDAITAKLEDGILMVTVPKVEKEWTEVKRVDIE